MERYKKVGPIMIHDIWFDKARFLNSKNKMVCLHTNEVLKKEEYDFAFTGRTILLDISRDLDLIFKGFEQKSCRYPINKARRDGVIVNKAEGEEDYKRYVKFENQFCKEHHIPQVSMEDMRELDVFYAVSTEGEYLGGCAFVVSDEEGTVRYKYGSTLHKLNANEAILWKAISYYHDSGFRIFDFGGVIPTDDRNSYYYRHYSFKKKFGGELVESFNYYKVRGCLKIIYICFDFFVKIFFGGDLNGAINWLNRCGIIGK